MEITVNNQIYKLEEAIRLANLPDLLDIQYTEDEKDQFFIADNNVMIHDIPEDAITEDGHEYILFQLTPGG